jgi:hypothetical protein
MYYQNLIFIILITFSLSSFYQDLMKQGHILYNWKLYLNTLPLYIAKPLGLCLYCSNVWIAILVSIIVDINLLIPNVIFTHQLIKILKYES